MAITRNKPDLEHNPSTGSYYKAVFISMYSQSYTPSRRIKHLPCEEKSKWDFSVNYYNSDVQGTQKVAYNTSVIFWYVFPRRYRTTAADSLKTTNTKFFLLWPSD